MQIQIHTDHHIEGHEALVTWATGEIKNALRHHSANITRVEAHLGDGDGHKSGGNDKRCVMEARVQGHSPLAVTEHAVTLYLSVTGAAQKLDRMIEGVLGRTARKDTAPPSVAPD
ncbi:MAG: HPF/RaiA family ribosome-associated protein [Mariniphaga sp.]